MVGSSKLQDKRFPKTKPKKTRRSWNLIEKQALADLLGEAVLQGWKSDNGFKTGYLNWLEKAMELRCPKSKLSGNVHINSKITGWKKTYGHLSSLARVSGLGWNSSANIVQVDDENVWNDYVRVNPEVEGRRSKHYPLYPIWSDVFGKDRATGEQAIDYEEAENATEGDYIVDLSQMGSEEDEFSKASASKPYSSTNEDVTSTPVPSPSTKPTTSGKSTLSGKKRNASESSSIPLMQVADDYLKKSEALFITMADKLGFGDTTYGDKNKVVTKAVEDVPDLSDEAILFVIQKIMKCPANTETFLNSNTSRRHTFVKMVLEGKIQ